MKTVAVKILKMVGCYLLAGVCGVEIVKGGQGLIKIANYMFDEIW